MRSKAGFGLGIYALPILMAPDAPSSAEVEGLQSQSAFSGTFRRDLADSDFLHWGEGDVSIGESAVTLLGCIALGHWSVVGPRPESSCCGLCKVPASRAT
ncbi:hypothetical protein F0M18_18200 [Pseudohalioglobus sediminis]|uniref:Uncharacterized protein n=1 Tax=Pseudohalioglobus sediminis TaxID=2606449 RepID=A0A5B0WR86_9GAMM|nr:hypothetical protein [Pseudohalioglobus sediminis]KAA1188429.1 hypothetical protein F0M18_18200 [Pseudohalioglobus sediminis]